MKWHKRFIEMAQLVSTWSKDPSTQVGVVLVDPKTRAIISTGYNGIARGVRDFGYRLDTRPEKYDWIEHAERNAVFNAARRGIATEGAWAYMNYAPCPCADCTRALIQAGVVKIIGPDRHFDGKGRDKHYNLEISPTMLSEAGVETITI